MDPQSAIGDWRLAIAHSLQQPPIANPLTDWPLITFPIPIQCPTRNHLRPIRPIRPIRPLPPPTPRLPASQGRDYSRPWPCVRVFQLTV